MNLLVVDRTLNVVVAPGLGQIYLLNGWGQGGKGQAAGNKREMEASNVRSSRTALFVWGERGGLIGAPWATGQVLPRYLTSSP